MLTSAFGASIAVSMATASRRGTKYHQQRYNLFLIAPTIPKLTTIWKPVEDEEATRVIEKKKIGV